MMFYNRGSCDWRHIGQELTGVTNKNQKDCLIRLIMMMVVVCASAANGKYGGGAGNSTNPYLIYTAKDVYDIGLDANDWDKCFLLMSDIDMNDYSAPSVFPIIGYLQWDPYDVRPFKGSFDGNNKKISNLTIGKARADLIGLFGYVNGQHTIIKDLTLINPNINGTSSIHTGAIAGRLKNGIVTGCSVENGLIRGSSDVGGMIGYNVNGTITNCTVEATISGTTDVGGLIGYNCANAILECGFSGIVSGQGDMGGLVGENDGQITNCYAMAAVVGSEDKVGGLIGTSRGPVNQCFAIGSVTGKTYVGGLVGRSAGQISDSYAQGMITESSDIGGSAGLLYDRGTITRCYAVCSLSSNAVQTCNLVGVMDDNVTVTASFSPKTISTSAMMTAKTYTREGWDFAGETNNGTDDIWKMPLTGGYPILSWQKYVVVPLYIQVKKCSITAGSKVNSDKISFSGTMNAITDDFNDVNNFSDANFVKVTISSENTEDMAPCVFTFPVDSKTYKKGKFSSTITNKPSKMSFAFDTKKKTFSFSASNVDLTGLSCPVIVTIRIGGSSGSVSLDETIVNGTKKLIPYQLMMGAEDLLMADKVSFKRSSKPNANSLTVSGRFTTADGPDLSNPMVITVGSQTFTVTGNQFLNKNGVVSCSNAVSNEAPLVRVTAKLDYVKCTFAISVKYASIIQSGVGGFGIDCFGVNLDGLKTIDLEP